MSEQITFAVEERLRVLLMEPQVSIVGGIVYDAALVSTSNLVRSERLRSIRQSVEASAAMRDVLRRDHRIAVLVALAAGSALGFIVGHYLHVVS